MTQIRLDHRSSEPLYHQIANQVRQLIAADDLKPGDRLPTVRNLAQSLHLNYNTVVRAYLELEKEHIVIARRGGGTVVAANTDDPGVRQIQQRRLSDIVSDYTLRLLSLGYSPEEVEAAFYLHLARWREERKASVGTPAVIADSGAQINTIRIVGSHDLALSMLLSLSKQRDDSLEFEIIHAGSLGGLIALQEERAHLAGVHLLDEETGEYNYPYIKRILPGREIAIVHLAYRIQGLMFASENPKQIEGLADLRRPNITFINRQKGSGTRILLEVQLRQNGITASDIKGYEKEVDTHLAVASAITKGKADVGLGIEAAARSCNLGFLPLFRERYDLVMTKESHQSKLLSPLLELIPSEEFRKVVEQIGGYDISQTGTTTFL